MNEGAMAHWGGELLPQNKKNNTRCAGVSETIDKTYKSEHVFWTDKNIFDLCVTAKGKGLILYQNPVGEAAVLTRQF